MAPHMVVREAVVADAPAIARVHGRAWQFGYSGQLPAAHLERMAATLPERTERWRTNLIRIVDQRTRDRQPSETVLVASFLDDAAELGDADRAGEAAPSGQAGQPDRPGEPGEPGEVLGICSFGHARDADAPDGYGELWMLNLDPDAWGTGLADGLFAAASARLAERYTGAYLWVLSTNQRAQRFYRRQGWEPDGVSKPSEIGGAQVVELRHAIGFATA